MTWTVGDSYLVSVMIFLDYSKHRSHVTEFVEYKIL